MVEIEIKEVEKGNTGESGLSVLKMPCGREDNRMPAVVGPAWNQHATRGAKKYCAESNLDY